MMRASVDHDGPWNPARLIPLDGAFNFRDLGGYPAAGGRATRWGMLFRSDTLHELSTSDVDTLRSLGLATVVDLRTSRELERTGRGPLGPEPDRLPASVGDPGRAGRRGRRGGHGGTGGDDLSERYLWYLEVGAPASGRGTDLLGEPAHYPLVFHCAAGKDRTGVLAALVLDLLGVDPEVIVADYLITADADGADPRAVPIRPRLRRAHRPGPPLSFQSGGGHHGPIPRAAPCPVRRGPRVGRRLRFGS